MRLQENHSEESKLLFQLEMARRTAVWAALNEAGLQDVGQPKLLVLLGEEGEDGALPAQWELAEHLHVSQATIANSLNSLERLGYVARQSDPKDRRKKRVAITEKGREAKERCIEIFRRIDQQTFAGFDGQELEQMQGYCRRIVENLKAVGGSTEPPCCSKPDGKEGIKL